MRTAETIEQAKAADVSGNNDRAEKRKRSLANLKPWKPGQSGNPSGRPKHDVAREIARAIFENNPEIAYQGLGQALSEGSAYVFKELADRAYGKMTDKLDVSVNAEVVERLASARKRVKLPSSNQNPPFEP